MTSTPDGVGVNGGAAIGVVSAAGFRRRLLGGVAGTSGTLKVVSSEVAAERFFAWLAVFMRSEH
jgi:hypothetical protein